MKFQSGSLWYVLLSIFLMLNLVFAGEAFLGISYDPSSQPSGLKLNQVTPGSPADLSGLRPGDVIILLDDDSLHSGEDLVRVLSGHQPGDRTMLTVQRCGERLVVPLILGRRQDFQGEMRRGGRKRFPGIDYQPLSGLMPDTTGILLSEMLEQFHLQADYDLLLGAFAAELDSYHGYYTLDAVAAVLLNPALLGAVGKEVLANTLGNSGSALVAGLFRNLDVLPSVSPEESYPGGLSFLSGLLQNCNGLLNQAFGELSAQERQDLSDFRGEFFHSFFRYFYLHNDPDPKRVRAFEKLVGSTKKIDYALLAQAAELLAGLDNKVYLETRQLYWRRFLAGRRPDERHLLLDTLILVQEQPPLWGRLLVGDEGTTVYTDPAAVIIDLGGDDVYLDNAGGTPYEISDGDHHHFDQGRVGICLDLGGDDLYLGNQPGSCGGGLTGLGLLVDLAGNDSYVGDRLVQGAAWVGVGLLHDYEGDDRYQLQELGQGAAFFGVAALVDDNGNDLYSATEFSQGLGGSKGAALLLERRGNDRYFATHKHPNGYGNRNTWSGWSQGVGFGFRQLAAGGVGILHDLEGDDSYLAGNFSQACGYFFGLGIFADDRGNDEVRGNRYCQGALAHQAAAWFRDGAGDDYYWGQEATNQAGTWDVGAGLFQDLAGNDRYHGGGLSLGGAAQNSLAFFIDFGGHDSYAAGGTAFGEGGANTYSGGRGARSLGIFLDLAGADEYRDGRRENNSSGRTGKDEAGSKGVGCWWDR